MESGNEYTHLTLEERRIIRTGIEHGSTKTAIARTIGKDNSTIGKEIKLHRKLKIKCKMPLECSNYRHCKYGRQCTVSCPDYKEFSCKRRDRSPGACNGCSNYNICRYDKYYYDSEEAEKEYRESLIDSRAGYNVSTQEVIAMGRIMEPLLKQGLSPYTILQAHPEIKKCEKTIYTYIENGVFEGLADIRAMDLRRQVGRKITKKTGNLYKERNDRRYLNGRLFQDYNAYMEGNPNAFVTQMDTVYNDESNGPFIQTFKLVCPGMLFALLQQEKTAAAMISGVDLWESVLGTSVFRKYAEVLLTDRGTEFTSAAGLETGSDGTRRTRVFYCDPMRSNQKGTLENNHIELRYILPKGTDLRALGLLDQDALNLVLSHINSMPVEKYGGKSPLEVTQFLYPDLYEKLVKFGIRKIPVESILLKPYLLKAAARDRLNHS